MSKQAITRDDLEAILNAILPDNYVQEIEELKALLTLKTHSIPWAGTTVNLYRRGVVVLGMIWNPRTVSAGYNTIGTLPVGWRPVGDVVWITKAPNSTSSGVELRYSIATSGLFQVYNYGSAWTNTDSNSSASFTYVAQD